MSVYDKKRKHGSSCTRLTPNLDPTDKKKPYGYDRMDHPLTLDSELPASVKEFSGP